MNNIGLRVLATTLGAIAAAALLAGSLKVPLWHMRMEAPQYQGDEALRVRVYPGRMAGDLREIGVLNQYVGVRVPEHLPQFDWLPATLMGGALLGLLATALPWRLRGKALLTIALVISIALVGSAVLAQYQMHELGHRRNHHAALKGISDFTPPLLGRAKIANFEITAGLGTGAALIAAGVALQLGIGMWWRRREAGPNPCVSLLA